MNYGFVKIAAAVPSVKVGDCDYNIHHIIQQVKEASAQGVAVVAFPELCITGYTCADLFLQPFITKKSEEAVSELLVHTRELSTTIIVGAPLLYRNRTFNTAIVISKGNILGIVPKTYLPNYAEFYEKRWFTSSAEATFSEVEYAGQKVPFGTDLLFKSGDLTMGVEICEDLWVPIPPSAKAALAGANLLVNLSASNEIVGKHRYLKQLVIQHSAQTASAYLYASAGFGESTTDLVFAGNAFIAENGNMIKESKRFDFDEQMMVGDIDLDALLQGRRRSTTFVLNDGDIKNRPRFIEFDLSQRDTRCKLDREINSTPFIPSEKLMNEDCEEIFNIQVSGLAQRIKHTFTKNLVVGISGGLDSTLALLVCVKTIDKLGMDRSSIVGVTMPGFGTTDRTYNNAIDLMKALGVTIREIPIKDACIQHFKDLGIDSSVHDITYENSQARERTQILMDIANQVNGMVVGTGDLSELALGWATYNGDHMSMYNVNGSVAKTLVQHLVRWVAKNEMTGRTSEILIDVVETPISPELTPADDKGNIAQKTEDLVGPYELHDFFLYNFLYNGYSPSKIYYIAKVAFAGKHSDEVIKKWLYTFFRRFFMQQFKRSCLPDGPKVGAVSLSPRGDWRMPSDASSAMWLKEIENL